MERVGSYPSRLGTRVDGDLLTELFRQLDFEVEHLFNKTAMVCLLILFVVDFMVVF